MKKENSNDILQRDHIFEPNEQGSGSFRISMFFPFTHLFLLSSSFIHNSFVAVGGKT